MGKYEQLKQLREAQAEAKAKRALGTTAPQPVTVVKPKPEAVTENRPVTEKSSAHFRHTETEARSPQERQRALGRGADASLASAQESSGAMTEHEQSATPPERWTPQTGPRDAHGRWVPVYRTDASERERANRKARDAALRRERQNYRTVLGRRCRALENQLRAALLRQGRVITVHDDLTVSHVAQLAVRLEMLRGEQSRGVLTSWSAGT